MLVTEYATKFECLIIKQSQTHVKLAPCSRPLLLRNHAELRLARSKNIPAEIGRMSLDSGMHLENKHEDKRISLLQFVYHYLSLVMFVALFFFSFFKYYPLSLLLYFSLSLSLSLSVPLSMCL